MKNYKFSAILLLLLFIGFSCKEDINDTVSVVEDLQIAGVPITIQSLDQINDGALEDQLRQAGSYIRQVMPLYTNELLRVHDIGKMFFDEQEVIVAEGPDGEVTYTFLLIIPNKDEANDASQFAYLSIRHQEGTHIGNELLFGFQLEFSLSFDGEGSLKNGDGAAGRLHYTPKPSNLPSKAPKAVICRYRDQFGINASTLVGYCDGYTGYGGTVPAPQHVLDALFAPQLTHNYNNLYFENAYYPNGMQPFSSFYSYYWPGIKTEIINYYQRHRSSYGFLFTTTGNITQHMHVNKQAFVDSWFAFIRQVSQSAPATFNYLIANKHVYYQLFNFFADYNLKYDATAGVYLGVFYGIYSSNQDVRCLSYAGQELLTSNGLTLLQQLGSGAITLEQFRSSITSCN